MVAMAWQVGDDFFLNALLDIVPVNVEVLVLLFDVNVLLRMLAMAMVHAGVVRRVPRLRAYLLTMEAIVGVRAHQMVLTLVLMMHSTGGLKMMMMLFPIVLLVMRTLGRIRRREDTEGNRYTSVEVQVD